MAEPRRFTPEDRTALEVWRSLAPASREPLDVLIRGVLDLLEQVHEVDRDHDRRIDRISKRQDEVERVVRRHLIYDQALDPGPMVRALLRILHELEEESMSEACGGCGTRLWQHLAADGTQCNLCEHVKPALLLLGRQHPPASLWWDKPRSTEESSGPSND